MSEAKKEAKKKVAEMRQVFRKLTEEYKANKSAMDAAAFKVLDVSGDGKLQEEEVLNALMLGTPQNKKLQAALGFGEVDVGGAATLPSSTQGSQPSSAKWAKV